MATKDLIEGFQTGFNIFTPMIAHNLRMKELKKKAGLDEEAAVAARKAKYDEALRVRGHETGMQEGRLGHETGMQKGRLGHETGMQEGRLGHETGERKGREDFTAQQLQKIQYFTDEQRIFAEKHVRGMSKLSHKQAKDLQKILFSHKEGESKLERGIRLKVLEDTLTQQKAIAGDDRDARKLIAKLERKTRREIAKNSEAGSTHRTQINAATQIGVQALAQQGREKIQGRAFGQEKAMSKLANRQDRARREQANELGKNMLGYRDKLSVSQLGRVATNRGNMWAEYYQGVASLKNPGMTERERTELYGHVMALRETLMSTSGAAVMFGEEGNVDGLDKLMQWQDTGGGPSPNPGTIPRLEGYQPPAGLGSGYGGLGGGGQGTTFGLGNPQGRNERVNEALDNRGGGGRGGGALPINRLHQKARDAGINVKKKLDALEAELKDKR